jgi:hypothetical protein
LTPIPLYLLSLPERVARSLSALAGGLARNLGDIVVPAPVRRTHLYRTMVDSTLRFLIEQVGQVEGVYPSEEALVKDFLVRRTAGNGLEMLGVLAFRASPVWVLAALADVSGTGRTLVREIADELQREGLLDKPASPDAPAFETMDQLLDGLEATASRAAEAVNTPPLDVASLREEWEAIRTNASRIPLPTIDLLWRTWDGLKAEAANQRASIFELSSLMALSALRSLPRQARWLGQAATYAARRTGVLFADGLLTHYATALQQIHNEGYLGYWARELKPYLAAALSQFSPERNTFTERLFQRGRK